MTNENRLVFLCAEHFPAFFFSVVSPLILKNIHLYSLHAWTGVQIPNLETAVVFCQVSDLLYLSPGSEAHYVSPGPCKAE